MIFELKAFFGNMPLLFRGMYVIFGYGVYTHSHSRASMIQCVFLVPHTQIMFVSHDILCSTVNSPHYTIFFC